MKKYFQIFALILTLAAIPAAAAGKTLVNVDKSGLALKGFDPVAYFTDNKPVKGTVTFQSTVHGVRYQFTSADHKASFDANPAKYEPRFGGFCAYAASQGHAAPISPDAFTIIHDRLVLNYDKDVRETFNKNQAGYLKDAEANWPGIIEKEGHN